MHLDMNINNNIIYEVCILSLSLSTVPLLLAVQSLSVSIYPYYSFNKMGSQWRLLKGHEWDGMNSEG